MAKGIKDPVSGKTYTFKGFTPLRRVSAACTDNVHTTCPIAPEHLITQFDIEFTKKYSCLCNCHFEEDGK